MKKIILAITYAFCVISIFFIGAAMFFIAETKDAVFDDKKLKRSYSHCEIYAADGAALDETQSDVYVTIDTLPENVKKSFIAIEDKRFYEHNGVDPRSVLRALKNNLLSSSVKEGGSTISQQLIKNVFLSSEKTISRKLKEIKLTYILENKYTKDEILELYLNNVYFGEGAYGIYEASEKYFGITPDKLDLCQSALLAALVKAPSFYDPYVNMDAAKSRRDLVIDKMAEQNYIAEDDVKELKKSDIILNNTKNYDRGVTVGIMKEAKGLLGLNAAADLDGYKIYTSIDRELCSAIPTPKDYGIDTNYTILVSDNKAKRLIAASYNVTDLKRCPASSAKPWLIYAPAIEERAITEATKIDDSKTDFNGYTPSDFGEKYYGFISAKECLAKSLNVPAVKIATCIGLDKISEYAKKMNITYDNDDLSVAIGNLAGGITVNQLLDAYTVFSNDGFFYHSSPIEKIVDKNGYTVYKRKEKERKVFSDGTAFIINDMLKETVKSGTAKKLSSLGYEICAKTGTNGDKNGNTDAYCVAYTPEYTVVVWLGNKDNSYMDNSVSGGTYPAAIVYDVLKELYKNSRPNIFLPPESVVSVQIDKRFYVADGKMYVATKSARSLDFYFIKGTEPKRARQIMPVIKDYKITYNEPDILIYAIADDGVEYRIEDKLGNLVFDSRGAKTHFRFRAMPRNKYVFYLQPYVYTDGKIIEGEKIKLPEVNTSGKRKDEFFMF